ncbi:MAG: 50S ribosomal protein L34e [Candidatus Diapherotrites archaeon]|nr:50S ribosomal protein L34e [Candidatus Diapherotrites archaeon]
MPTPGERSKKKKFVRVISKTKIMHPKKKASKHIDPITGKPLAGVPHGKKRGKLNIAKTKKRPSAVFGGVLSGESRRKVIEEAAKVKLGLKKIEDVPMKERKFVEQAMKKIE